MEVQYSAVATTRMRFYNPAVSAKDSGHQAIVARVKEILGQQGLAVREGESFGLSLNDDGTLNIVGDLANKDEIGAALNADKELVALVKQSLGNGIEAQKPVPEQGQVIIADTVEISNEAMEKYSEYQKEVEMERWRLDGSMVRPTVPIDKISGAEFGSIAPMSGESIWDNYFSIGRWLGVGSTLDNNELVDMLRVAITDKTTAIEGKIDTILADNGIILDEDAELKLELDEQGKILVSGLDDKAKAEKIAELLNDDETLSKEIEVLWANRRVYESVVSGDKPNQRMAVRRILLDDHLQNRFGISLDEISVENGQIKGNDELESAIAEDGSLGREIREVLDPGMDKLKAEPKYIFQNGALVDEIADSEKANFDKLKGMAFGNILDLNRAKSLLGNKDDFGMLHFYNENIDSPGKKIYGFDINMDRNGKITVDSNFANGDRLDNKAKSMITGWFSDAFKNMLESVADSELKKHQAEDGDVDDYGHEMVFHVNGYSGITTDIFSDEADTAIQKKVEQLVPQVVNVIESYLIENGIELNEPINIEVADNGRLRVDINDGNATNGVVKSLITMLNAAVKDSQAALPKALQSALEPLKEIYDLVGGIHNKKSFRMGFSMYAGNSENV